MEIANLKLKPSQDDVCLIKDVVNTNTPKVKQVGTKPEVCLNKSQINTTIPQVNQVDTKRNVQAKIVKIICSNEETQNRLE